MKSVREQVSEAQSAMIRDDFMPSEARNILTTMNGLLGSAHRELRVSEVAYKHVLRRELNSAEKANRARINAECSPEYERLLEAKHVVDELQEMIRSLKVALRSLDAEMQLAR